MKWAPSGGKKEGGPSWGPQSESFPSNREKGSPEGERFYLRGKGKKNSAQTHGDFTAKRGTVVKMLTAS